MTQIIYSAEDFRERADAMLTGGQPALTADPIFYAALRIAERVMTVAVLQEAFVRACDPKLRTAQEAADALRVVLTDSEVA